MSTVKQGEKIILAENYIEIDIFDDFTMVRQQCLESKFFLKSLEIQLNSHLWDGETFNKESVDILFKQIGEIEDSFKKIEFLHSQAADVVEDVAMPLEPSFGLEIPDLIDYIQRYLELKSKIDRLQIKILDTMNQNLKQVTEKFASANSTLTRISMNSHISIAMSQAFTHSADEDKVITYALKCKNKDALREIKKSGAKLPTIKIRDYSFVINKKRVEFQDSYKALIHLMSLVPQIELNEKQTSYNRQVTILTYIISFLTIIMLIQGSFSLYFNLKESKSTESINVPTHVYNSTIDNK